MWGKVSDIFGRKPILLLANSTFFVGSLICALSIDIGMLEAGRVIQGAGAGGLMTLVNICISDMFSMRCATKRFRYHFNRVRLTISGSGAFTWASSV